MRKSLFFGNVLLLFLFLTIPVLCQQNQDKTAEAKKETLEKRGAILKEIHKYIQGAVEDGKLVGDEMEKLKDYTQRLKDFDKKFKQVYGDQPQTDAKLNKAVDEYFSHLWRRDKKGIVQAFFASRTGRDVVITSSFSVIVDILVFFIVIFGFFGFLALFISVREQDWVYLLVTLGSWVVAVLFGLLSIKTRSLIISRDCFFDFLFRRLICLYLR